MSVAPPPKRVVAAQNEQSYNMLGQMMGKVSGPVVKKPRPRRAK